MYQENRQAIEQFFSDFQALQERLERRDWGTASNIHYSIECGHLRKRLWENYPQAASVIDASDIVLCSWTVLTDEQRQRKEELQLHDPVAHEEWMKTFYRQNRQRVSLLLLKAYASIEVPLVPEPTQRRGADTHRLGKMGGETVEETPRQK